MAAAHAESVEHVDGQRRHAHVAEGDAEHADGRDLGTLETVGRQRPVQYAVGHVRTGRCDDDQCVRHVCVDQLCRVRPVGIAGEQQDGRHAEGEAAPLDPAAVCTRLLLGGVGHRADDRVVDRVKDADDQHQHRDRRGRDPDGVRVEDHQIGADPVVHQVVAAVADAVCELLLEAELDVGVGDFTHTEASLVCSCHGSPLFFMFFVTRRQLNAEKRGLYSIAIIFFARPSASYSLRWNRKFGVAIGTNSSGAPSILNLHPIPSSASTAAT